MVRRQIILVAMLLSLLNSARAEEAGVDLLPDSLLAARGAKELVEMRCTSGAECALRCGAGEGQPALSYNNVRRVSYAMGTDQHLVALVYLDALGKAHRGIAMLPPISSCIFDDLEISAVLPFEDGQLSRQSNDEVIFELRPDN